jgi:hypothetical protein
MSRAIATALLLSGCVLAYAPVATDGHDLRGPKLAAGTVLLIKETGRLTDGVLELDLGGGTTKRTKMEYTTAKERRVELQAVEGRQVTKQRVEWARFDQTIRVDGGEVEKTNQLAGRAVVSERKKGAWSSSVEAPKADDPANLLAGFYPWSADDLFFPARGVKVGDSWDVPEKELKDHYKEVLKTDLSSARAKVTFKALETVGGEPCAVVEIALKIKGTTDTDGVAMGVEATSKLTTRRSLRTGLNVRVKMESEVTTTLGGSLTGKMTARESSEHTLTVAKKP